MDSMLMIRTLTYAIMFLCFQISNWPRVINPMSFLASQVIYRFGIQNKLENIVKYVKKISELPLWPSKQKAAVTKVMIPTHVSYALIVTKNGVTKIQKNILMKRFISIIFIVIINITVLIFIELKTIFFVWICFF